MAWKIKHTVVHAILESAKHTYPDEFIALLGGNNKEQTITELVILPAIFGSEHAELRTDLLPFNANTVGSIHSHPGYSNRPSPEDLDTFAELGPIHLIVCEPFTEHNMAAYDQNGRKIQLQIVSEIQQK
ncbi:MAG: Mov34/MPN/PAD-1 family protein [Candidatus Diapherotrites archaeon]|uniref:Mov34/MPN/PAD-1 family protein n=1 Tax=Candidatus Iainarchaeum sp. TaxID=3101447 RepID=A0A8T4L3Z5_9ARCH|nr:Mov34/MPN/PAD-1 family protein [Candidatus Diapherotrites archaeon]